jgi:hypothetical protein
MLGVVLDCPTVTPVSVLQLFLKFSLVYLWWLMVIKSVELDSTGL